MRKMKKRRRSKGDTEQEENKICLAGSRKAAEGKEPPWALPKMPVVRRSIRLSAIFFIFSYASGCPSAFRLLSSLPIFNCPYTPNHFTLQYPCQQSDNHIIIFHNCSLHEILDIPNGG
jgi:hypothetical protein